MEELKLILQMLQGLGETAKEAFVWYLVLDRALPPVMSFLTWAAIIGSLGAAGYFLIRFLIGQADKREMAEIEKNMRREMHQKEMAMIDAQAKIGYDAFRRVMIELSRDPGAIPMMFGEEHVQAVIATIRALRDESEVMRRQREATDAVEEQA